MANNFAGIYHRAGGDFAYLDGSNCLARFFPKATWFSGSLIVDTYYRSLDVSRPPGAGLLLQAASLGGNFTWHPRARGNSGDFVVIGVEPYMDYGKIGYFCNRKYGNGFFTQELGWIALLGKHDPKRRRAIPDSYASTTLDEIEYQMNRALGYGLPIGLITELKDLQANGLTNEILTLIGTYEELRLSNYFPQDVLRMLQLPDEASVERYQLKKQQWHLVMNRKGVYGFRKQAYAEHLVTDPAGETWTITNPFAHQPLQVKITALPSCNELGGEDIELLNDSSPPRVDEIADGVTCTVGTGLVTVSYAGDALKRGWCKLTKELTEEQQRLSERKVLAIEIEGMGRGEVISIQFEDRSKQHRQYQFVPMGGKERKVLHLPATKELFEDEYDRKRTPFEVKDSLQYFDYKNVERLSIFITNVPPGGIFSLHSIKALPQKYPTMNNPSLTINTQTIRFPLSLAPRCISDGGQRFEPWDYLFFDGAHCRKYNGNNVASPEEPQIPYIEAPALANGTNTITYRHEGTNKALVTILMEDRDTFHGDYFIRFSALGFIVLRGRLTIERMQKIEHILVRTRAAGNEGLIALCLTLPPNIIIKQITVYFRLSNPRSYISQVRLTERNKTSFASHVEFTASDSTSTTPRVYHAHVDNLTLLSKLAEFGQVGC